MGELRALPNIGDELEEKLNQIGITTTNQLREIGSINAFIRIKAYDSSACINMLMAIEGAVQGVRWHNLDTSKKQELKALFKGL